MPVHTLQQTMPEADFLLYAAYAAKRMLPSRRLEVYLAQLTAVFAQTNGGQAKTSDFLLDPVEQGSGPEETPQQQEAALDALFGFGSAGA